MAAVSQLAKLDSTFDVDKLSYEIFSILENKFLFGPSHNAATIQNDMLGKQLNDAVFASGKVRILTIDGGRFTDGILAAASLSRLETFLRRKSGEPSAAIADYFDVVAGSGAGGILAALLFTRGKDGRPMFDASKALDFMVQHGGKLLNLETQSPGLLRRVFRSTGKSEENRRKKILDKVFGEFTLKDTIKPVLIPCYDLSTCAPFLFSRADALEMDGYDFRMSDVCLATSAAPTVGGAVEMGSVDGKTRILVVGGIAMSNPTAAAITHVLHNKMEFPSCKGVEDLVVVSLGNGEELGMEITPLAGGKSSTRFVRIAGEGASDMVDQAVSMAFGQCRAGNYVRIQANGIIAKKNWVSKITKSQKNSDILAIAEQMLAQKNVESVLFQGKKVAGSTNLEKLEAFAGELVKEQERRKTSVLSTVVLKQSSSNLSPRTSSATTLSTTSSC